MEKEVKIKVMEITQNYYDIIGAQGTVIHSSLFLTEDDFIKDDKEEPKTQIEEFVQIMEATGKVIRENR